MRQKILTILGQAILPTLTIVGQIMVSIKLPEWGLLVSLLAQPFWLYSTWISYKKAGQTGMFINAVIMTVIIAGGAINYWFL